MTDEEYKHFLNELSEMPIKSVDSEPLEYMLKEDYDRTFDAVNYRVSHLTKQDFDIWGGLLSIGFFRQFDSDFRLACFCMCIEASTIRHKNEIEQSCAKYCENMPLFKTFKGLYNSVRKGELINYRDIKRLPNSLCFSVNKKKGYGIIDRRVPMPFLSWLEEQYADKPAYIRLDPYVVSADKIPDYIQEAIVNFPDPAWWKDLSIYDGKSKGSSYQLLNDPHDKDNYWDYLIKGIRSLEFHAQRRDEDKSRPYLSMMMEELEVHPNPTHPDQSYLIGRMIHLDTTAAAGDSFNTAVLKHIDLAYNYYYGENMEVRLKEDLSEVGKVTKADFRTHILRIEDIKLVDLFPIAFAFFKSQTMVYEWAHYQFMDAEYDAKHRIILD